MQPHIQHGQCRQTAHEDHLNHDRLLQSIQQEAQKTRKTIWLVAMVSLALILLSPFLFAFAPLLALIIGIAVLSAFLGAMIGKAISRIRERRIMTEITSRDERSIIPIKKAD